MVKIIAKNKAFNGLRAGIEFVRGQGETDDKNLIKWFSKNGYTVEVPYKETQETSEEPSKETKKQPKKKE